jgi:hypothetical protein
MTGNTLIAIQGHHSDKAKVYSSGDILICILHQECMKCDLKFSFVKKRMFLEDFWVILYMTMIIVSSSQVKNSVDIICL